jgi:CheY-like chemotaxis protein
MMPDPNEIKKKITVVEDDPDILFTVTFILSNANYEVTGLNSGEPIKQGKYACADLFILDKRMPDMDGLELCRYLRTKPESRDVPVIIISASPNFDAQAMQAGASGFLNKPFQMNALLDIVQRHLH